MLPSSVLFTVDCFPLLKQSLHSHILRFIHTHDLDVAILPSDAISIEGFIHTHDLDLVISLSDAISIEILPSFQIAIAGDSKNM
jgi:hypothetical protein